MARQRFSIFFRNTLARWLKAWAKRLELDALDADAIKDGSIDEGAVAGQADGPPAHWLERVDRQQQPPAHWLAHASVHGRTQERSHVRLRTPEPPDAGHPGIEPSAEPPSATQTPELVPPAADESKRAVPQPKSPLRLIPYTRPAQEETAETSQPEEPPAQAKKPSIRKAEEKAPEPTSRQKRQTREKSRTTLRLEPRPRTERAIVPSEESFSESAATLSPAPAHNLEPRQRNEKAEPKRATEPDSQTPKDEDAINPIPQPQPGPADLWPRHPRPQPVSQPSQAPEVLETTQWVKLKSKYAPAATHTPASPDHPPPSNAELRLPEKAIEEDNAAAAISQPRSDSQGKTHTWPQKQEEEMDRWPELPAESLEENVADDTAEGWEAHLRAWQRCQKLDREQRGILWNESPS
jgi:hypothetical protein